MFYAIFLMINLFVFWWIYFLSCTKKYDITIKNTKKPEKEIQSLLKIIDGKVKNIIKENITIEKFLSTLEKENNNPVGIITCLMELEQYEKVLSQIEIYKKADVHSGYSFGSTDFFDFVINICNKKMNTRNSVLMKIGNRINKIFKNWKNTTANSV